MLEAPTSVASFDGLLRFVAGAMLGLALVAGTAGPARADVEEAVQGCAAVCSSICTKNKPGNSTRKINTADFGRGVRHP